MDRRRVERVQRDVPVTSVRFVVTDRTVGRKRTNRVVVHSTPPHPMERHAGPEEHATGRAVFVDSFTQGGDGHTGTVQTLRDVSNAR